MTQERWQQARLIPTSGITGTDEAERRATSALLSVIGSVKEFGVAMTKPLGAPTGPIEAFIEVPFKTGPDGDQTVIPDGLLRCGRANKTWTALVEVKTGSSQLEKLQIESYLDVARDQGYDVVLTISNELAPAPGMHPVDVDKRKLKKVALHHVSWAEVLTIAVQQRVHRGVSDPDQAWILGELIRYLEHPKSGALDFSDMGQEWVAVREAVATGTLRSNDKSLNSVVHRWEQLLRFEALRLGRELGVDAQVQISRKELAEPSIRFAAQAKSLVNDGTLTGTIRIPDAAAPLDVVADIRSGRVTVSIHVDAPRDGRPATRVNWLIRQLKDAPGAIRIDGFISPSKSTTSELLTKVREVPTSLLDPAGKELKAFRVAAVSPLGTKRGVGQGSFIDSVVAAIDGFYGGAVQGLRLWTAKAPQLPAKGLTAAEQAGIDIDPHASESESIGHATDEPSLKPSGTDQEVGVVIWSDAEANLNQERQSGVIAHSDY
jgi:hypothetical protein